MIFLAGAICGWWLIYVIPVALHMQCLYGHGIRLQQEGQMLNENLFQSLSPQMRRPKLNCSSLHNGQLNTHSKLSRQLFYYSIVALGLLIALFKLLETFNIVAAK